MNLIRRLSLNLLHAMQCYWECLKDGTRFIRAAKFLNESSSDNLRHLESDIIRRYHVIEKGLAMPEFRPLFGLKILEELICQLRLWDASAGPEYSSNTQVDAARRVVQTYVARHADLGLELPVWLLEYSPLMPSESNEKCTYPVRIVGEEDQKAFKRVVDSRHSVRDFVIDRIPERAVIQSALEQAIRSPSVCNRQTWRVHAFEGAKAQIILEAQNGNRGFGQTIPTVLIITSDLRFFSGSIERYQAWIDGGMFSMTLLLGLHANGLGAVPLNWSVLNKQDKHMRKLARIPSHERIIMLVGCGYAREEGVVTASPRNSVDSFIRWE